MKFVVIGGDAAGMSAASRAKRNDNAMEVTVLEKTGDVSFSACGMPYNIAVPEKPIEELVVRRAEVFRQKQGIHLLTGHTVERIDPERKAVFGVAEDGAAFSFPYDKLLIATGGTPVTPDFPGHDLPGVFSLKILDNGRKLKAWLHERPVKKVVIVGTGYIGLEMCESLRERGLEVDMVKPGKALVSWTAPELSETVQQEVEFRGARIHLCQGVKKIEANGSGLSVVCQGRSLDADMVLVAIGIRPNSDFAAAAGLALSVKNAISVDRHLCTSNPDIYAAGDCADAYHVVTGEKTWIPLALVANRGGWTAADNVCGIPAEMDGVAGTAVFKIFDLEMARTGLTQAEAVQAGFDPASVVIQTRSRAHAHPGSSPIHVYMIGDKKTGRLLGAQMLGREGAAHRINAAAVALHAKMTVEQFSQTDLSYAPPFGPVWDPLLTAANQLLKKL
jgi:NADPH-dependent 2,4-dienoyl-CoA reductase/sulfur reductase-like enzyme